MRRGESDLQAHDRFMLVLMHHPAFRGYTGSSADDVPLTVDDVDWSKMED